MSGTTDRMQYGSVAVANSQALLDAEERGKLAERARCIAICEEIIEYRRKAMNEASSKSVRRDFESMMFSAIEISAAISIECHTRKS